MQRILVTGGAGFIGSHTVDLLLAMDKDVVVLDNLTTGKQAYLPHHPRLQFILGDVLDAPILRRALQNCDAVLHLAALPSVPKSIENPIESSQVNTIGFLQVLEAVRAIKQPIRVVYASSAAVYGENASLPCCDESILQASFLSPYALEKANNERYADLYKRLFNIPCLGLRYFNVYGVRQDPLSPYAGVISKFIEYYQQDNFITIYGDGEQSRDFIHVADVARANVLALTSDCYGILNIATGVPETLRSLLKYIEAVGRKPARVNFVSERAGDIKASFAKVEKAQQFLGFRSTISLSAGIMKFLQEYQG